VRSIKTLKRRSKKFKTTKIKIKMDLDIKLVSKFEVENFWLIAQLDLEGGWVDEWIDRCKTWFKGLLGAI
jgi:hypothetical protein